MFDDLPRLCGVDAIGVCPQVKDGAAPKMNDSDSPSPFGDGSHKLTKSRSRRISIGLPSVPRRISNPDMNAAAQVASAADAMPEPLAAEGKRQEL